jgi:hypothetical protein
MIAKARKSALPRPVRTEAAFGTIPAHPLGVEGMMVLAA